MTSLIKLPVTNALQISLSQPADVWGADDRDNNIRGRTDNDTLSGYGGNDTLDGGRGDDRISGGEGNDVVYGGLGNDQLQGDDGNDLVFGGDGDDTIFSGSGADTMIGGTGDDLYVYPRGRMTIVEATGGGTDTIIADTHFSLSGLAHVENLTLVESKNLNGIGNYADNVITGNDGNNRLRGSLGADTMDGGKGRDTFVYGAAAESTGLNHDFIKNMHLDGEDRFDFGFKPSAVATVTTGTLTRSGFDADIAAAVDGALTVHGAVLFDPSAGHMNIASHAFLIVDADGDGAYRAGSDYVVELFRHDGALTLDDFI